MNTTLSKLNNIPVSTYITNLDPINHKNLLNSYGSLIVADNSENNITNMSSYYGIYVDNVFVAGGYGFKTFEEYSKSLQDSEYLNKDIKKEIEDLKKRIGNEEFGFNSNITKSHIISAEYNTYGFICEYKWFQFQDIGNNTYTFNINNPSSVKKISNIYIRPTNEGHVEYDNDQAPFNYSVTLEYDNLSDWPQYNADLSIYVNSEKINPINPATTTVSKVIQKENGKFYKDLTLEIKNKNNKIVYSYFIPKFAKWEGKFIAVPDASKGLDVSKYDNTIYLNFRDTGFTWTPPATDTTTLNQISNLDELFSKYTEYRYFEFGEEFEVTFNSGTTPLYDYLIFDKIYQNIEFYFNGIKSNNWYMEIRNGKYIWQSPQPYLGQHTWKIKINR